MPPRHNSVKIRFNSSSCSVKFSAAQYQLWKCTFRLYNNHFMKLNLFSNVLRLHFHIYIYSEIFEFSKRSKQRFSKACLLKKKRSRASFRYAARKHATLSIFASHPPASECTVSTNGVRALGETRFFESYFCQTEIKV